MSFARSDESVLVMHAEVISEKLSTPERAIRTGLPRWVDATVALFCLVVAAPLVALLAIAIALTSGLPVLFRQKRVGQFGRLFDLYKLRTMKTSSSGPQITTRADTRITRLGKFLRQTKLDELPTFWNVLRGEMTLVGPRPPLSYEIELYSSRDWLRLSGKPGLTGLWQVYGRSRVTFENMVDMDIMYLQQQSLWKDIKLMLLTVPVMLLGRGGA